MQTIPANQLLAGLTLAEPVTIRAVVTDSRKVEPGCVFVCFPGERVDGHDYAAGAYRSGAEYIVANHPVEGVPADRTVIVPDSGKAMIRMASNYRMLFNPRMIGVTGSVGKTTTKEFCYAVLSAFGKTLKTEGNQNNDRAVCRHACKGVALYETGVSAAYGDKLITLSTCDDSGKNSRVVVVAKRITEPR